MVLLSPVDGRRLVKRVVGVPGDVIELRAQRLLVNGVPARYAPVDPADLEDQQADVLRPEIVARETVEGRTHAVMAEAPDGPGSDLAPHRVPPDRYFLMGDHRDSSYDSRFWGDAERRAILGRVEGVAVSVDYDRYLAPRWRRFLRRLEL